LYEKFFKQFFVVSTPIWIHFFLHCS
jgi:hypothetical protein